MPLWPVVEPQATCFRVWRLHERLSFEGTTVRRFILSEANVDSSERWFPMQALLSHCYPDGVFSVV